VAKRTTIVVSSYSNANLAKFLTGGGGGGGGVGFLCFVVVLDGVVCWFFCFVSFVGGGGLFVGLPYPTLVRGP